MCKNVDFRGGSLTELLLKVEWFVDFFVTSFSIGVCVCVCVCKVRWSAEFRVSESLLFVVGLMPFCTSMFRFIFFQSIGSVP